MFKQLASGGELKHEVVPLLALEPLFELDNVVVLEFQERVLAEDLLLVIADLAFVNDLDRDLDKRSRTRQKQRERESRMCEEGAGRTSRQSIVSRAFGPDTHVFSIVDAGRPLDLCEPADSERLLELVMPLPGA